MAPVRCTKQPSCRNGIVLLSTQPPISNNIIQNGLAFVRERSGSVTVPGTKRASRSRLSLNKDCPQPRRVQPASAGNIIAFPEVGGLHHRYERRAA
jgi:hypothetical protein